MVESGTRSEAAGRGDGDARKRSAVEIVGGLPEPARGLVLELVKRTRLWKREKRRVAAELVGHFEDGIEAGESVEELVKRFGDARTAARLIRRAQKRQRGLIWKLWNACWKSVGCLVVVYLAVGLYLATGRPVVSVDYEGMLLKKAEGVPADEAAWPLYREALGRLPALPDVTDARGETIDLMESQRPGDAHWGELAAYLRENKDALALIRLAAARPGLGFDPRHIDPVDAARWGLDSANGGKGAAMWDGSLIGLVLYHLQDLRRMGRLISADMYESVGAGDGERAVADVATMLGIGRHGREIPLVICELTGFAVDNLAFDDIRTLVRMSPGAFDERQLVLMAHLMGSLRGRFEMDLSGERMFFYDLVQRLYTPGEGGYLTNRPPLLSATADAGGRPAGGSAWDWSSMKEAVVLPVTATATASRGEVVAEYERRMDAFESERRKPMWEWDESGVGDVGEKGHGVFGRLSFALVDITLPALRRSAFIGRFTETERGGVETAIALELYHRKSGRWPGSLDELVPGLMPAVPIDPYDGKALRYRLDDRGLPLVYSVGADGDDDGGRMAVDPDTHRGERTLARESPGADAPDGDWVLWPVD